MAFGSKWWQHGWLVYTNAFTNQIQRTALFVHKINAQIIIWMTSELFSAFVSVRSYDETFYH